MHGFQIAFYVLAALAAAGARVDVAPASAVDLAQVDVEPAFADASG